MIRVVLVVNGMDLVIVTFRKGSQTHASKLVIVILAHLVLTRGILIKDDPKDSYRLGVQLAINDQVLLRDGLHTLA
jgi:hypothetical protein